tara:strand:- start:444 stop:614 length:171 start_codon:yes stop_codon:yes gene_type:complete
MANKKSKAKKDEISPGVKFPSKDELRKMYSTPDDLREMTEQELIKEANKIINQINK